MAEIEELNDQMKVRREKMENLREAGIDPFGHKFTRTHNSQELHEAYDEKTKEELHELALSGIVAGRLMTKRGKGKIGLAPHKEPEGQNKLFVGKNEVGEENY